MTHYNPYVQNLIEKGYSARECQKPAAKKQFPLNIHGRIFETEEEYNSAISDYINGL